MNSASLYMNYEEDKVENRTEFGAQTPHEQKANLPPDLPPRQANSAKRRNVFASTYQSLQYIGSLPRKDFRKADRVSDVLVIFCQLLAVMLIVSPPDILKPPVIFLAGFIFLSVIIFFIMNRMGILITLSPRQAVLVWDIVLGALLLGVVLSIMAIYSIMFLTQNFGVRQ